MSRKLSYLLLGTGCALGLSLQSASATVRQVGGCTTNPLQYGTIQAAVNASNSGDSVQICPGTYPEQVVVSQAMTLTNVSHMPSPTVTIPSGGAVQNTTTLYGFPAAAQILVAPSTPAKVNVKNLIVDGSGNNINSCNMELFGIYYQNAGGTISGDAAQNQLLPPADQGCQNGEGIFVESQTTGTPQLNITGNSVTNFDKNAITVSYGAAFSDIENNTVTGMGPTTVIAQNGIQLGYGASGHVLNNMVSDMSYTPGSYGATGILLYDTQTGSLPNPTVSGNTVSSVQYGIVLEAVNGTAGHMVAVGSNGISGAQFAGIGLYSAGAGYGNDYIKVTNNTVDGTNPYDDIDVCSDYNTIHGNTVSNSAEGGIHLDGLCTESDNSTSGLHNTVSTNQIDTNCVGILSGPPPGANNIERNNVFNGNTNNYEYGTDSYSCGPHAARRPGASRRGSAKAIGPVQPLAH